MSKRNSAWRSDFLIIKSLYLRDLTVLRKDFFSELINLVTWPISLAVTFGYVLPSCGMSKEFGSFMLVGAFATAYFYLAITMGSDLVNDIESHRCIDLPMIAPISSYKILLFQKVTSFTFYSTALVTPLLPIGKMFLPYQLDLAQFSLIKFLIAMFSSGLFFGCLALMLASLFQTVHAFGNVWRRVYTPMLLCGGYWFSFQMAQMVFGKWSYFMLLNPLTFMSEGIRSSVFGPEKYFNYWACMGLLSVYTIIVGLWGFKRIQKRLDAL